ncbi:MAG TPA: hypothetical protein VI194_12455 [Mycobacterium sp.]
MQTLMLPHHLGAAPYICRSLPEMLLVVILINASVGHSIVASGTSSTDTFLGPSPRVRA